MNIMTAAFDKAGIHPRDAEFNVAIAKYLNSGGDFAGAQALLDAAELMSGDGHSADGSKEPVFSLPSSRPPIPGEAFCGTPSCDGHGRIASSGKPLEGEDGPRAHAQESPIGNASSPSSNRDGRGRHVSGSRAHLGGAPPVREPSTAQRAASLNVAKVSIVDTLKIDGRPFRDWGLGEAERAGRAKTRDGFILCAAAKRARLRYANLKGSEKLADLLTEGQVQRIHRKAGEIANAA